MAGRIATVVLALAAAVVLVPMGWARHSQPPTPAEHTTRTEGDTVAIRDAVDRLSALESCLRGVRRMLPALPASFPLQPGELGRRTDAASARLADCQNGELGSVSGAIGELRTTAPWAVVHAAELAQADAQQAGLALDQLVPLLRHVSAVARIRVPGGATVKWSRFARSFRVQIERMGRRRRELRQAPSPAPAGT